MDLIIFLWIQHSRYALNILNAFEINKESLPYSCLKNVSQIVYVDQNKLIKGDKGENEQEQKSRNEAKGSQ